MASISLRGTMTSSTRRRSRPSSASTMPWRSLDSATSASARSATESPVSRSAASVSSRRGSSRNHGATSQATMPAAARRTRPSRRSQPRLPSSRISASPVAAATATAVRAVGGASAMQANNPMNTSARSTTAASRVRRGSSAISRRSALDPGFLERGGRRAPRTQLRHRRLDEGRERDEREREDEVHGAQPHCRPSRISSTNLLPK